MSRRLIAAVGDVNEIESWSGIPYHLLEAGLGLGIFHEGLRLECDGLAVQGRRTFWNLSEWALGRGIGGFQYSDSFLETMWRRVSTLRSGDTLINLFQLFPSSIAGRKDLRRIFYIDQTLAQLFEWYPDATHISSYHRKSAIDMERKQYLSADLLIAHCQWAADSLIGRYGVPTSRVAVVLPGANINSNCYAEWEKKRSLRFAASDLLYKPSTPMRFVFVGKDAHRKGLDRILAAMNMIPSVEQRMHLSIVGAAPDSVQTSLRHTKGVTWLGPISKVRQTTEFVETLASHDVGVLLSRAEAGGISLREFQRVGLAVLGPSVGGASEMVLSDAGVLIAPNMEPGMIAETIQGLIAVPERVENMKRKAWERREEMSWDRAVLEMKILIS
jgi:glycosyltransferase involved in cell wall biosynthesis